MLMEDHQQNQVVPCLLCKQPIKVGAAPPQVPSLQPASPNAKPS